MPLVEEMERAGAWLFRFRSWAPPLVMGLLIGAVASRSRPTDPPGLDPVPSAVGIGIAIIGLLIRAHVVGHAPGGTSGKNRAGQVASSLTTTGLYSVVRHPLYLGNYFLWLGPAVATAVWWCPLLVSLIFGVYYERIMMLEESFLRRTFGPVYLNWAERTPALLPRGRWVPPPLSFSWRTVFKQEYYGFFSAVAMFAVLEAATRWLEVGRPGLGPVWTGGLIGAVVVSGGLRILQRYTHALDVEGR